MPDWDNLLINARISRGERIIDPYHCKGLSVEKACIDAITDLFHLIDDNGMKINDIIRIAKSHFEAEREN